MAYFYSGLWVFCKAYCSIYSSFFSKDMHGFPGKSFQLGLLRFLLVGISIYLGWNLISDPTALTRCVMRKNGVLVVRLSFLAPQKHEWQHINYDVTETATILSCWKQWAFHMAYPFDTDMYIVQTKWHCFSCIFAYILHYITKY